MKRFFGLFVIVLFLLSFSAAPSEAQQASAAQAKLWVEKADKYVQEVGLKQAIAEFNNPKGKFVKGDLYINVFRLDGKVLAFPMDHSKVGLVRFDFKDIDGKSVVQEFVKVAKTKGFGWVDYKYLNQKTKQVVQKTGYVKRVEDVFLLCAANK